MRSKEEHHKECGYLNQQGMSNSEREHYSKVYGINRSTVLLELHDFDVTQQLPQDIMHVVLEGIFPYHMEQLLNYIIDGSILTLAQINSRIMSFPYSYFNVKPSPLRGSDIHGSQTGM